MNEASLPLPRFSSLSLGFVVFSLHVLHIFCQMCCYTFLTFDPPQMALVFKILPVHCLCVEMQLTFV